LSKTRNWWWFIDRTTDYEAHMHAIRRTIVTERTQYQEVGIFDSAVFGKILLLDGDMQSAQHDEFVYHEALVQPAMTLHENPERILILGGGEGATLREVLRHKSVKEVYMVDIDERLIDLCKTHLPEWSQGSFSDPRLKLCYTDATKWIEDTDMEFDVIISDLTEPLPFTPSSGTFSLDYFRLIKSRIAPGGIYAMQASRGDLIFMANHSALYRTLVEIFPEVHSYLARIHSFDYIWSFMLASEAVNPRKATIEEIDSRLEKRLDITALQFYDGEAHQGIFATPKYFRKRRNEQQLVLVNEGEMPDLPQPTYLI